MSKNPYIDMGHVRLDEQRAVMEQICAEGHCPFCPENLFTYHKQPILRETPHWYLTPNQWPYKNITVQLLLIHKEHAEELSDIDNEAFREIHDLATWAIAEYEIPGGGLALRFGETAFSGGTVKHIHAQLIQPSATALEPVRFKIGTKREPTQTT